ncbi:alpha/beta hydrolase [Nocardia heshunensis]
MIWQPPAVGTLGYLVGMKWPEGNEDQMWGLADDWRAAAKQLESIKSDVDDAISAVQLAYPQGDGGKEMIEQLKVLKYGGDGSAASLDGMIKWFDQIAAMADGTGNEFEYTKLMFNATLIILAAELLAAAASLIFSPAVEAAEVAATRITVRFLIKRLLKYLAGHEAKWATAAEIKEALKNFAIYAAKLGLGAAIGAGLGAAPDAGIQAWQRYEGRREKFDWGEVGTMALAGGVGGLVGAPVGAGLKNVLGRTPLVKNTVGKVFAGGITTIGTGATAGLAGWGASALATGNTELDPRMITAGAVGGLGSGLLHSYKDARVPTVTDPSAVSPEIQKPSSETPASQSAPQNEVNTHPASTTEVKADNAVRPGADTGNGQQLTNLQSGAAPGGQAAPSPQNVGTPKASDVAQPANPARGATPAEVRPAGTAAPRTETPHSATPPPETPKAGAAPKGDTGIGAPAQAKPTGIEAATPKVSDRAQVVQQEHGAGVPSEHPEKARPVDGNGAQHEGDNGAKHGDKPEGRIGARPDDAAVDHDGTGDKDHGNRSQPTDQTHGSDKEAQNHDKDGHSHNEHDQPSSDPQQPHEHEAPTPSEHPNHPVLPEDRPITDAERLHAQEALERLGHEDPSSLLHPENTDQAGAHNRARENHEWWHSLTDDQQDAMARVHPREIGNADGIPTPVRDQANRLSIARDMVDLRENNPRVDKFMNRFFDPDGYREYKNLSKTVENLRLADRLADTYAQRNDGHRPPVRVLSYDARAFNGEGRAVVAFGDVDKASTVSYHIPGITTTVRSLKVNLNNSFNHFWETSRNTEDPGAVASIAWIGYDAPSGIPKIFKEMAHTDLAKRGGQLLARDVAAFNETRKMNAGLPDGAAVPDVHLFGHSYGSTTTSFAGAGGRLAGEVTTITLLGSPGAGPVPHASRFGIGDNVFVASSPRDPVTWIGSSHPDDISRAAPALGLGLGLDPSVDAFGARRITAQFPGGIRTFNDIGTHTAYYKFHDGDFRSTPSESLYNFGKIAAGQSHEIIPEYPRPDRSDLGDFQRTFGSTPHDPAKFRSPEYELAEGPPHGYDEFVNEYRNPDPVADHTPHVPDEHRSPNDCGPQALQHVQELTGNPNIHVPDDPQIAHRGMSAEELENAAGAHMQPMDTPGVLADQLYRLGDGATAIVVDEYHGPVDDNGVGAHAYTVTNDGGMLVIHDPALGEGPHPFPGDRTNVANTHAIIYDSHGDPLHPHDSTADAHHSPSLPEARIGQPDSHPKLPVEDKPYYANPHYEDPRASQEYAAKNRLGDGEIQDIRAQQTANHPEIARLTDPELDAIRRNQYFHLNEPVNDATRNGNTQALHDRDVEIRTLISAYNKLPDHNGVVYRSLYIDDPVKLSRFLDDYQQGKTPVDHGFASSDKEGSMPGGNIEMIIDSRFGKDISWATGNQDEVVFPPGNKFLVKDHYPTTDRYGNPKYVIELQDLGRADHEPGGIRPDSPASDAKPQTPLTGRPEVGGDHPPEHGRPGEEGTPPGHGRPDQDLASVGRIGDQSDQPRVGRDELAPEDPSGKPRFDGPDENYKPFSADTAEPHPDSARQHPADLRPDGETPGPVVSPDDKPFSLTNEQQQLREHPPIEEGRAPLDQHTAEDSRPTDDQGDHQHGTHEDGTTSDVDSDRTAITHDHTQAPLTNEVKALADLVEHPEGVTRDGDLIVEVAGRPLEEHVEVMAKERAEQIRAAYEETKQRPGETQSRRNRRVKQLEDEGRFVHPDQTHGTVTAVVVDPRTGIAYEGVNGLPGDVIPWEDLHPTLQENILAMEAEARNRPEQGFPALNRRGEPDLAKQYQGFPPGTRPHPHFDDPLGHAEVKAANQALWQRERLNAENRANGSREPEMPTDQRGLAELRSQTYKPFERGGPKPTPYCANCNRTMGDAHNYSGRHTDFPPRPENLVDEYHPKDSPQRPPDESVQSHGGGLPLDDAPVRNDPAETSPHPTESERPMDDGPQQPVESARPQEVPHTVDAGPERAPIDSIDRPSTLTPHLIDRFNEMHQRIFDIASAYHDPTRAAELPHLRRGLGDLMDKLGMLDPSTAHTPSRLLNEYHPELYKYLAENHEALLPHPSDTAARHEPAPHSADRASDATGHRPNDAEPQRDPSHPLEEHVPPADPLGHYADRTPAGLSLHTDPEMRALAHLVPEDPRFFTIDAHLTERGTVLLDGHEYTMQELAARLPELGYDGRPIRLIGCDAASTDAAAHLAKATGTGVLAPTRPAWTDDLGHVYSSTAEITPEGLRRPRIPPDGDWEFIRPDGAKIKVSEDGFVPGTRDEDKHNLNPEGARDRSERGTEPTHGDDQGAAHESPDQHHTPDVVPDHITGKLYDWVYGDSRPGFRAVTKHATFMKADMRTDGTMVCATSGKRLEVQRLDSGEPKFFQLDDKDRARRVPAPGWYQEHNVEDGSHATELSSDPSSSSAEVVDEPPIVDEDSVFTKPAPYVADMGHVENAEYWRLQQFAIYHPITQAGFQGAYNDRTHYRLEDSSANRGHGFELDTPGYGHYAELAEKYPPLPNAPDDAEIVKGRRKPGSAPR